VGRKARPEAVTVTELKGHPAPVAAVDWSHDLSLLASGDIKGMVFARCAAIYCQQAWRVADSLVNATALGTVVFWRRRGLDKNETAAPDSGPSSS
jgi:hypothetical protein